MSEFLRKYWFVTLVGIIMCIGVVYYIMDLNKDNVSAKKVDGKDVVASTTLSDVDSDTIYEKYQNFNQTLLYNMYRKAVVQQSVEATSEMKSEAKKMENNVEGNVNKDATGKSALNIQSELASYGFEGDNALYDYCLFSLQAKALDEEYVKANFDSLKDKITTSPRTVSIITMNVANPDVLTEDAQKKKENIEKALEKGDSFASTATAFSEDTATAGKEGFFGYIDSSSTSLDSEVVKAAIALEKDGTSDWITVKDSKTGTSTLYKIHVNETDPKAIMDSEDATVRSGLLSTIMGADSTIDFKAVAEKAKGLDIKFENEDVQTKIEKYIADQTKGDSNEK